MANAIQQRAIRKKNESSGAKDAGKNQDVPIDNRPKYAFKKSYLINIITMKTETRSLNYEFTAS